MDITPMKVGLLAGGGVAAYLLYQWWQKQEEIEANMTEAAANGGVAQPASPTAAVPAMPTEQQAVDPAYWESVARDIASSIPGMGALPPWPSLGPRPRPPIGPVYSLTPFR